MIICSDCVERKKDTQKNPTVKQQYKMAMNRLLIRDHALCPIEKNDMQDLIIKLNVENLKYLNMAKNVARSMLRTNWEDKTNE